MSDDSGWVYPFYMRIDLRRRRGDNISLAKVVVILYNSRVRVVWFSHVFPLFRFRFQKNLLSPKELLTDGMYRLDETVKISSREHDRGKKIRLPHLLHHLKSHHVTKKAVKPSQSFRTRGPFLEALQCACQQNEVLLVK